MSRKNNQLNTMLKKAIFSTAICFGLMFTMSQTGFSQEKTPAELKAELTALQAEMKSSEAQDRKDKIEKLEAPKTSGVKSVDLLANNSTAILASTKTINAAVEEMYTKTMSDSFEAALNDSAKAVLKKELAVLSLDITTQATGVASASEEVVNATGDLKGASPLQIPKATKSLNYSKDVLYNKSKCYPKSSLDLLFIFFIAK